ncbi:hypothetical protein GCM10029964_103610 [Kibdelosporangium lantanae]
MPPQNWNPSGLVRKTAYGYVPVLARVPPTIWTLDDAGTATAVNAATTPITVTSSFLNPTPTPSAPVD